MRAGTVVALTLIAGGCAADVQAVLDRSTLFTSVRDVAEAGETLIEVMVAEQFGAPIEAVCENPPAIEPAVTFPCSGTTAVGTRPEFVGMIGHDGKVTISLEAIP